MKKNVLLFVLFNFTAQPQQPSISKEDALEVTHTNGMLVFLNNDERGFMKALSYDALLGLLSEAGPLIISRSLLANLKRTEQPTETDPEQLLKQYNEVTATDTPLGRTILLSVRSFDDVADRWIIKQVSSELYLLVPKKMVPSYKVSVESIEAYAPNGITTTEQMLGLKVNHMKTVGFNDVTMPQEEHKDSDYFVTSLPSIFVGNSEYTDEYKKRIPAWAIYTVGHGVINQTIVDLSLNGFKQFLTFLQTSITTKLLLYVSCYPGGANKEHVYKDLETKIERVYPFTIITQGLTDAVSFGNQITLKLVQSKLTLQEPDMYKQFFTTITSQDVIDYHALIQKFLPPFDSLASLAQIKYAQLPWFSVLDTEKVVSIGSIMAKTRTMPLAIATFFGKQKSEPLGILLYAQTIPFELIINTARMPGFVSMIPGSALHRIKKISSQQHDLFTILASFTAVEQLAPRKLFFIEEISSPLFNLQQSIAHVIIDYSQRAEVFYTYRDQMYMYDLDHKVAEPINEKSGVEKYKRYTSLLTSLGIPSKGTEEKKKHLDELVSTFNTTIFSAAEAENIIKEILDIMPDNSALHIPTIKSAPDQVNTEKNAWYDMLVNLEYHTSPLGKHKMLWIDGIEVCETPDTCYLIYENIIIEKTKYGWFRILFSEFYDEAMHYVSLHQETWDDLPENYVPEYEKTFAYYQEHGELPIDTEKKIENIEKRSIHKLITREHVEKLKRIQEKKIRQQKEQAQKQKEETKSSSLLQKKRTVYGNVPEGYGRHRMKISV